MCARNWNNEASKPPPPPRFAINVKWLSLASFASFECSIEHRCVAYTHSLLMHSMRSLITPPSGMGSFRFEWIHWKQMNFRLGRTQRQMPTVTHRRSDCWWFCCVRTAQSKLILLVNCTIQVRCSWVYWTGMVVWFWEGRSLHFSVWFAASCQHGRHLAEFAIFSNWSDFSSTNRTQGQSHLTSKCYAVNEIPWFVIFTSIFGRRTQQLTWQEEVG